VVFGLCPKIGVSGKQPDSSEEELEMKTSTTKDLVTRQISNTITREILEAVKPIIEKHGLNIGKTTSKYGDLYSFTIQAEAIQKGRNGVNVASNDAQNFIVHSFLFGLSSDEAKNLLGSVIFENPKLGACILIGYSPRNKKMPVIVKSLRDEKQYFVPETYLDSYRKQPTITVREFVPYQN